MAIMISIPAGITANQASAEALTANLGDTITQTESTIIQTLTQIECTLSPNFEGFGFAPPLQEAQILRHQTLHQMGLQDLRLGNSVAVLDLASLAAAHSEAEALPP